jgi:hypothetical protein
LEQNRLIFRPCRTCHQGGSAFSEPEQRLIGRYSPHPVCDAVETRITKHPDPVGSHTEAGKSHRVVGRDRGRGRNRAVSRSEQRPSGPAEPATANAHGGSYDGDFGSRGRRAGGQLRPKVELRKDQQVGLQHVEQAVYGAR